MVAEDLSTALNIVMLCCYGYMCVSCFFKLNPIQLFWVEADSCFRLNLSACVRGQIQRFKARSKMTVFLASCRGELWYYCNLLLPEESINRPKSIKCIICKFQLWLSYVRWKTSPSAKSYCSFWQFAVRKRRLLDRLCCVEKLAGSDITVCYCFWILYMQHQCWLF